MVTKQNRKLTELKNIGKKIVAHLNELGIFSEAVKAHYIFLLTIRNTYKGDRLSLTN